ncbi:DUF7009 family protein [Mucilaginibacter sp. AW1-3]
MKIRIRGNTVRYRLTRPEVEQFKVEGVITEQTDFGNKILTYILRASNTEVLKATFDNDMITMLMPENMASEWTDTERVGFENEDGKLMLYVEKDFKCLDNVAEDQSDNYPNPLALHSHEHED